MIRLLLLLFLLLDPPALHLVSAVSDVLPGQVFSVTITQFGDVGAVQFDAGGLEVVADDGGSPTRVITLRAAGVPRDVVLRAWGSGVSDEVRIRVCCTTADDPVDAARRVYFPSFYH